jgi:hypothetical protein
VTIDKTTVHYSKVLVDEDGQVVMVLKDDLMTALNLLPNEILKWTVGKDQIIIDRIKLIDNKNS